MRPRIDRAVPKGGTKPPREGMSRVHLERVAALPCLICGAFPGDAHHLKRSVPHNEKGKGLKAPDRYVVPLCRIHHTAAHDAGDDEAYLTEHGFDGRAVSGALWAHRSSPELMARVVYRARQEALLKKGVLWA